MSEREPSFCVIIPMYNEEPGATECVAKVCRELETVPLRCNLLVVEDGSSDKTFEILDNLTATYGKLQVVRHIQNSGYGKALRTGVDWAVEKDYDYALFMDSDLTNDPGDIPLFVQEMRSGTDVIKGSRFSGSGRMEGVPFGRTVISWSGNFIARRLFRLGIHDCTNGFRALRLNILARMNLRENGFPIIVEELYQAKFLASTYSEIPVVLTNRRKDQRPTSFSYKPSVIIKYLGYAMKACFAVRPLLREPQ